PSTLSTRCAELWRRWCDDRQIRPLSRGLFFLRSQPVIDRKLHHVIARLNFFADSHPAVEIVLRQRFRRNRESLAVKHGLLCSIAKQPDFHFNVRFPRELGSVSDAEYITLKFQCRPCRVLSP